MDVFLIPTLTREQYELYYEAPDEEVVEAEKERGLIGRWIQRVKAWFGELLREAEEWRQRRHELETGPVSLLVRIRRRVMGFIVERIAEQRLLWHMRKATEICATIPSDLSEEDADKIIRDKLRKDADHHRKWLLIDSVLLIPAAMLVVIPGPNIPGLYFLFQVIGHFLSMRGAKQGLAVVQWTFKRSPDLAELRQAMTLPPGPRQRRFRELASRLRLEHLATFLDDVAAQTA